MEVEVEEVVVAEVVEQHESNMTQDNLDNNANGKLLGNGGPVEVVVAEVVEGAVVAEVAERSLVGSKQVDIAQYSVFHIQEDKWLAVVLAALLKRNEMQSVTCFIRYIYK